MEQVLQFFRNRPTARAAGLLSGSLIWLVGFLVVPLIYLFLVSFGRRSPEGLVEWVLGFSNYARARAEMCPKAAALVSRGPWGSRKKLDLHPAQRATQKPGPRVHQLLSSPRGRSAFINDSGFNTPNLSAARGVEPWLLAQPSMFPRDDSLLKCEFMRDIGPAIALYDQYWTEIKSG